MTATPQQNPALLNEAVYEAALADSNRPISTADLHGYLDRLLGEWVLGPGVERLLLLPPDHTRLHSFAGEITQHVWRSVSDRVSVDVMPAVGTHFAMSPSQLQMMFGDEIPAERYKVHDWRNDLTELGEIPSSRLSELSDGRMEMPVRVAVNRRLVSGEYDQVLSIGQVLPHEVIGFANHAKNVCVGAGGSDLIHKSHYLGAVCNMETILGRADTPVRRLIDTAFYDFVRPRCDARFILTVVDGSGHEPALHGLMAGQDQECFRRAAELSAELNINRLPERIDRCVVHLDPREFSSTWLGNKSIYRTRMAMADGGELYVLAPGVETFGEDPTIDELIREHGYHGTPRTLDAVESDPKLAANLSAAAHLIHGSTEGRFSVTYCTGNGLTREEVEGVGYAHLPIAEAERRFDVTGKTDGWHKDATGQPFYYIQNPALGLWMAD